LTTEYHAKLFARALKIEEPLVDALLSDIEGGGTRDALPLLAFTLEGSIASRGAMAISNFRSMSNLAGSRVRLRQRSSAS
jgi:hypothetical protein